MQSNMQKYTQATFVEATKEQAAPSTIAPRSNVVMTPGVFPVCSVCGKDCRTLANDKYHILVGIEESSASPMLCRTCKSVVCQQCAHGVENKEKFMLCPKCGAREGLDWLLPFVYCDTCGKRAALISGAVPGEATYMLLDKGAVPIRCTECQALNCADCRSKKNTCQKCGSSKFDLFVPGYNGTGVIFAEVDPSGGHIKLAAPESAAAKRMSQQKMHAQSKTQQGSGETEQKSSSCFIATAACGSSKATNVICLQEFRDVVLKRSRFGCAVVQAYEFFSPPLARVIINSPSARALVRFFIVKPFRWIAELFLLQTSGDYYGKANKCNPSRSSGLGKPSR